MKTVVEIDEAVAKQLKDAADFAQISFDQALNRALSAGIRSLSRKVDPQKYVTQPHHFGTPMIDAKKALAMLEEEEDLERYRRGGG